MLTLKRTSILTIININIWLMAAIAFCQFPSPAITSVPDSSAPGLPGRSTYQPDAVPAAVRENPVPMLSQQTVRDLLPLYLIEKNGELIPALNWTPEELDSLLHRVEVNQLQSQTPDFICERLTLTGVQKGDNAEMELNMVITIPEKPLVRVPLQLDGMILVAQPQFQPGEILVHQPNGNGYVLFLKGPLDETELPKTEANTPEQSNQTEQAAPSSDTSKEANSAPSEDDNNHTENKDSVPENTTEKSSEPSSPSTTSSSDDSSAGVRRHEITLKILIPLQKNQSVYSMNLKLPKALYSSVKLEVPFPSVQMHVSGSSVGQPVEHKEGEKSSVISAYSLGTEFQMQWQTQQSQRTESPILESFSEIHVDIRSREILYTIDTQLQFAGKSPDSFSLYLPHGTELLPSPTGQYSIAASNDNTDKQRNLVEIKLNSAFQDSAKLTFQARLPIETATSSEWFDLMGFEILNAPRQSGCVGINVEKDHQVLWNPGRHIRRVDELPESFEGVYQFAFSFSEQPCSLLIRIVAGRTRMNVQPQYSVTVAADEMRLEAAWTYNIRGGMISWLDMNLNGWTLRSLKDIGPENVVSSDSQEDSGRVSVHLVQPTLGTVVLKMTLYKKINSADKEILFNVPAPVLNVSSEELTIAPGLLYVICATNVHLTPNSEKSKNLVKQMYAAVDPRYSSAGEVLCYRLDSASAQFAAGFKVHQQEIACSVSNEIYLTNPQCTVNQSFNYSVQYESIAQLTFEGPENLAEMSNIQASIDGQVLTLRTTAASDTISAADSNNKEKRESGNKDNNPQKTAQDDSTQRKTRLVAVLDYPRIGHFTVLLSYNTPVSLSENENAVPFALPLARSVDVVQSSQTEQKSAPKPAATTDSVSAGAASSTAIKTILGIDRMWELHSVNPPWKEVSNAVSSLSVSEKKGIKASPAPNNPTAKLPAGSASSNNDNLEFVLLEQKTYNGDSGDTLQFEIRRRQGMVWDTLTIDRSWIQTWLTATRRQDVACFRFTASRPQVTVCLPSQTDMGSLEVLLDGKVVDRFRLDPGQQAIIPLPEDQKIHVLEVSYYFLRSDAGFGKEKIQLPYIKESKWVRWMYWSIGVPRNIHLLVPPQQLNSEYSWQRQGPFFRRNSVYSWQELETWSGGIHLPPPPQGVNIYLFSGFGSVNEVEITLMSRTALVFTSSLIILFPGLILLHFKQLRQSWLLILIAVALLTVSLWEPELALVFLQAAGLGVMLLALSFLFRKRPKTNEPINESTVSQPDSLATATAKHLTEGGQ